MQESLVLWWCYYNVSCSGLMVPSFFRSMSRSAKLWKSWSRAIPLFKRAVSWTFWGSIDLHSLKKTLWWAIGLKLACSSEKKVVTMRTLGVSIIILLLQFTVSCAVIVHCIVFANCYTWTLVLRPPLRSFCACARCPYDRTCGGCACTSALVVAEEVEELVRLRTTAGMAGELLGLTALSSKLQLTRLPQASGWTWEKLTKT